MFYSEPFVGFFEVKFTEGNLQVKKKVFKSSLK